MYNESNANEQRTIEGVHKSIKEYRGISGSLGNDVFDVEYQESNGRDSELYRKESESDGRGNPSKGDGNSEVKYYFKKGENNGESTIICTSELN